MAITKPYTFQAGTKARASEVNQDFDILYSEVNRLGTEILNIDIDIQNVAEGKADINGNANQRFQVANPENSYDSVNKNYLDNSILNIKDYINGLIITKDTNNTIRISSGSCYDSTYTTMMVSTGNITKENSNQGANLTYYVYIISDYAGYQIDILISTQSASPALPSGYTLYRQIGSYTTDENRNINIISYYGNSSNKDKSIYKTFVSLMPDYERGITKATDVTHTATENGWVFLYAVSGNASSLFYYINGHQFPLSGNSNADTDTAGAGIWFMVSIGDTYSFASSRAYQIQFQFYPIKGE